MKVLIVKVSALGDVIHSLPVLAYLHSTCPQIEIDWLVEEGFASVLEGHPLLHQVIPLKTKRWRKMPIISMFRAVFKFAKKLRQEHYDFVFDLQGNSKSGFFTLLSRGNDKYGFERRLVREWPNILATSHRIGINSAEHHISQRALAVVKAALPNGLDIRLAGPLHVVSAARALVKQQLEKLDLLDRPIVVLNYGTTWQTKLWSLENWCQLACKLRNNCNAALLLTWGNEEEHDAAMAISMATDGYAIVWPRGSLPELVALLDHVNLVVGCDTGPVHIAAALGTPTVSMYRSTDSSYSGPVGANHILLQTPFSCVNCQRKQCEKDAECAASITVDVAYSAIMEIGTDLPLKG